MYTFHGMYIAVSTKLVHNNNQPLTIVLDVEWDSQSFSLEKQHSGAQST